MSDWMRNFGLYFHRRRLEVLQEILTKQRFSRALDIGCAGGLLRFLGVHHALGIDIKPGGGVTVLASAESTPFRSEAFDLVFAGEVLEHLDQPLKALKDWGRVLAPGGTLILSTPNGILVSLAGGNPEHKRLYSPRDLLEELDKLGFEVIFAKGIFTGLVSGKRLLRLLPFDWLKMLFLRLPVPLVLSYNTVYSSTKRRSAQECCG